MIKEVTIDGNGIAGFGEAILRCAKNVAGFGK